jgi:hypothetical protein
MVAKKMAMQEGTAAMSFHQQFDGRFLQRFAAEDLGDNAFHFAPISIVEQSGAPGRERVAPDN